MKYSKLIWYGTLGILLLLLVFPLSSCKKPPKIQTIAELKGPQWREFVGKTVTIEAIYVRDPLPMLVTDLDIVLMNMPMPEDQYIVLTGEVAEKMDPQEYGGAKIKLRGQVETVEDTVKYFGEYVLVRVIDYMFLERITEYAPHTYKVKGEPLIRWPHRFAVLFSGGINAANNHIRYWNDLKFIYSTLVNTCGFPTGNIVVLHADGNARDTDMPVDYSATQTNLETVFDLLEDETAAQDLIFMFFTNHGGGFYKTDPYGIYTRGGQLDTDGDEGTETIYESDYNLDLNGNGVKTDQVAWDEVVYSWGSSILDDSFDALFEDLEFDKMVIVMEQCFSSGLILDMARSGGNKVIMSAAGQYEPSEAMPPFPYDYDEFSYHFTCAINGADPDGNTVNADSDNDGKISMVEAFNYARTNDTRTETPWYEDSGDGIPHSGSMPSGGDGSLGDSTFLD